MFAEGAPIIAKGTRKQGWQINTADFIGWYVRHRVAEVTDDPDAGSYDIAKRQSLELRWSQHRRRLQVRSRSHRPQRVGDQGRVGQVGAVVARVADSYPGSAVPYEDERWPRKTFGGNVR
jgi:hypothetical protein